VVLEIPQFARRAAPLSLVVRRQEGVRVAIALERFDQVSALLAAPRAIVLVTVAWSPWPSRSRHVLGALEETQDRWLPDAPVTFFDLWPEREAELDRWYEGLCATYAPRFELHGHGYGPLWWLAAGAIVDCLTKPYLYPLAELQERSRSAFGGGKIVPGE